MLWRRLLLFTLPVVVLASIGVICGLECKISVGLAIVSVVINWVIIVFEIGGEDRDSGNQILRYCMLMLWL